MPKFKPSSLLIKEFPHQPTQGQQELFNLFNEFLAVTDAKKPTLMLRGYAGTGKTSIMSTIVNTLPRFRLRSVLLAPTGRAAKVMTTYSGIPALTIHKKIYRRSADPGTGALQFSRQPNFHRKTLFIVDEASMIADDPGPGRSGLLADLINYVFEHESNRLMIIGDTAQLPPVGQHLSKALDADYLRFNFSISLLETELTEVTRQSLESGILFNATELRKHMQEEEFRPKFRIAKYSDTFKMRGTRLEDGLRYAYNKYGIDDTVVICRSNKAAVHFNRYVRHQILYNENELDAGDRLMIVKNNYFVLEEDDPASFLANGDLVEVRRIVSTEEIYGFRFADLELQLIDFPDQPPFIAKVHLETLHGNTTSLPEDRYDELQEKVQEEYQDIKNKRERAKAVRDDEYINALQVKFAYALTCHKSQGGQWDAVFVDYGYMTDERINEEYFRWLYTGITRAKSELFFMNFPSEFFESASEAD
jgi:ATP-dependent exoDNAse (exonuclease V) alpha subunit